MNNIVGIGANVYDTLISISEFPAEDTKHRANYVKVSGGGPCATGLVTASKLGASAAYIGVLSDDSYGRFLMDDMKLYGLNNEFVTIMKEYTSFTSCIWLSESSATRTCVFDKGTLPPLLLTDEQKNAIKNADILMVDGNDIDAAVNGAEIANKNNTKVLYDAGGLYDGIEQLLKMTDILIPSEDFAKAHTGKENVKFAAETLYEMYDPDVVVITCGKNGGVMYNGNDWYEYPSFTVNAVDSNGAGDVFHGAFAFAVHKGFDYKKCCIFSSAVSALKCTGAGARENVPSYEQTIEFLKEQGYNEL